MTQAKSSSVSADTSERASRGLGRRRVLAALGVGLALTLSGCGFQLRGVNDAPMAITELDVQAPITKTHDALRDALERADVQLSDSAPLTLNLGKVRENVQQITYGDAGSIKRELTYRLTYSLQRKSDGAYLANQQELQASSFFYTNDDDLLNTDDLRERAAGEVNRDLSRQLLERLRAIKP